MNNYFRNFIEYFLKIFSSINHIFSYHFPLEVISFINLFIILSSAWQLFVRWKSDRMPWHVLRSFCVLWTFLFVGEAISVKVKDKTFDLNIDRVSKKGLWSNIDEYFITQTAFRKKPSKMNLEELFRVHWLLSILCRVNSGYH